jgi:hypothetical protein
MHQNDNSAYETLASCTHSQKQLLFIHSATSPGESGLEDIGFGDTNVKQMTAVCQPTEEVTQPLYHLSSLCVLSRASKSKETFKLTSNCQIVINE